MCHTFHPLQTINEIVFCEEGKDKVELKVISKHLAVNELQDDILNRRREYPEDGLVWNRL